MKWIENTVTSANDNDINEVISMSAIVRYLQDAANYSMEGDDPSYDELFRRGYAFILSRIYVKSYAPLHQHEKLTAATWACSSRGLGSERYYTLHRGDDLIAEAASLWAIVGCEDKKLYRADDLKLNYRTDEPLPIGAEMRFRIPNEAKLVFGGEKKVMYEDVDLNGHMNNTHYPDMLCGFVGDMRGVRVSEMAINYRSEAPLGETIGVYHGEYDGAHYLRTVRPDGAVNVEAKLVLSEL